MVANSKRRWFIPQFSLRFLLIVITIWSVWLGLRVRNATYQRVAVQALSKLPKTMIAFDHQFNDANVYDAKAELQTAKWLRKALGDDFFQTIASVALVDVEVDALMAERLGHLRGMRGLTLKNAAITADCCEQLRRLQDLDWFIAINTKVESGTLDFLETQKDLTILIVTDSDFDDRDSLQLKGLSKLKTLTLKHVQITDEGLRNIEGLDEITHLNLDGAEITDESIPILETLSSLKALSVCDTQITAEGGKRLKRRFNRLSLETGAPPSKSDRPVLRLRRNPGF